MSLLKNHFFCVQNCLEQNSVSKHFYINDFLVKEYFDKILIKFQILIDTFYEFQNQHMSLIYCPQQIKNVLKNENIGVF